MQRTLQAALPDLEQELAGRVGVWVSDMFLQHEPLQSPAITRTSSERPPPALPRPSAAAAGGGMGGEQKVGKSVGEMAGNQSVAGAGAEEAGLGAPAGAAVAGAAVAGAKLSSLSLNGENEAAVRVSKRRGNVSPLAVDLLVRKQKKQKAKDAAAACALRAASVSF